MFPRSHAKEGYRHEMDYVFTQVAHVCREHQTSRLKFRPYSKALHALPGEGRDNTTKHLVVDVVPLVRWRDPQHSFHDN